VPAGTYMLRRTALILTGFLLLSLAVPIGYALFGLGGPEYTIYKSQQALQAENYPEAIRLADVALSDRALDRNRELRRQALRVRYQAYSKVGDYRRALLDLGELIEKLRDSDVRLVLSRIEIILEGARRQRDMSQALRALERTRMVLAKQPNNPEALALAGDACRAIYDEEFLRLRERLRGSLSPRLLQTVMAKLADSTFRSEDDPKVAVLEREILTLLPERQNQHHALRNSIRTWVQRGQEYFLNGLRLDPPHVRAYLGIDDILKATGRTDQRLAQAEIYMQRATPKDAIAATAVAAKLHLDAGRYRACVGTADRVLAPAAWRRLAKNKSYSPQIQPILLAKNLALATLAAAERLRQSASEAAAMLPAMPMNWQLFDLCQGIALAADGLNDRYARYHLEAFCSATKLHTDHWTERQLLRIAYETRVRVEQRGGTDATVIANMLAAWSSRDSRDPRPLILTAEFCLQAQRLAPAVAAAAHAMRIAEKDDDVLSLYAKTAVAAVADTPRDLPNLVARCLRLQKSVPDNIGDMQVLLLPLAAYALRSGNLQIGTACAQLAAEQYPWARWPRYLIIEAALQADQPENATLDLEVLLRYHPRDRRANELLSQVLAGNPEQARALRYASAVYSAPNLNTARFLAQRLYARGDWDRVLALTSAANERFPPDAELMSLAARVLLNRGQHDLAGVLLAAIHRLPNTSLRSPWALGQLIVWNPTKLSPEFRVQLLDGYLEAESDAGQVFGLTTELRAHGEHVLAHRAATALVRDDRFLKQRTGAWFQLAGRAALQVGNLEEARDHLVAAAGFGDGKAAALDLTLLHLARDDLAAARESFVQSKRDGITAACVAARLGQKDAALARIRYRLEADPEHLPTLCMLACLDADAKVPAPVRALAQAAGDDLLELLAFLSTDAFFDTALKCATALAQRHPKNPAAVLLGLRAFARAGKHDGVVPVLFALRLESSLLMGEALRILNTSESPELRNSQLMNDLLTYVVSKGASAEPALLAVVIRHDKRLLAAHDRRPAVLNAIFDFWIRYPKLGDVGLDEVDLVAAAGMYKSALQLLEVIEPQLSKADRPRFLRTFYEIAPKVVAAEPHLARPFMDRAHKVLTDEGPHGAVLHFLLETRDSHDPWPEDPEARVARQQQEILFLRAHVERYHGGLDQDRANYVKSLARLHQAEDPGQSLERIEQALRDDPSLLDLWGYRARRLVAANQLDQAIDGLTWIPAYLKDPATDEILLPLRLRRDGTLKSGEEPGSALARGLLALGDLDFDAAAKALAEAMPQVDGSHLFYLAMAHLGQGGAPGMQAAAARFTQLAEEYPMSPLSFPALEFAAQLESDS